MNHYSGEAWQAGVSRAAGQSSVRLRGLLGCLSGR
jgi:hypothetical protein